ncbi:MAG TPA: transposase [Telluria sp.]
MVRPLRLEFESALYHVTSRGDHRSPIYHDDADREAWLTILGTTCKRFNFVIYAYCQMTNHYHLMVETVDSGLHRGMRYLNSTYAQHVNRRHGLVGHVFQGRYKAILCQKETYLLALSRYIVLNPVRASMAARPEEWMWSSYRHVINGNGKPVWLETDWLLSQFGSDRERALVCYRDFVSAGAACPSPLRDVSHQFLLGDGGFLAGHFDSVKAADLAEVPRAQRKSAARPLEEYFVAYPERDEAIARAYWSTAYSMAEIAAHLRVSSRTVSRAVQRMEEKCAELGMAP